MIDEAAALRRLLLDQSVRNWMTISESLTAHEAIAMIELGPGLNAEHRLMAKRKVSEGDRWGVWRRILDLDAARP